MRLRRLSWVTLLLLSLVTMGSASAQPLDEMYTVGFLSFFGFDFFKDEMASLGYIEGQNIAYMTLDPAISAFTMPPEEYMTAYAAAVQTMVDAQVDAFLVLNDTDAVNLMPLVGNMPIIFAVSDDPVATGAVDDLIAPGRNATGIITNRHHERRLQLLTEIKPDTNRIFYLYSTMTAEGDDVLHQVETIGEQLGVEVVPAPITDVPSAIAQLDNMPDDVDWLFLTPFVPFDPVFMERLNEVSLTHHAGIADISDVPTPGHVLGYGPNYENILRRSAHVTDLVLRGADPATVPLETAENYLLINLEAADAIGLPIPEVILRQATSIIRPGYFDALLTPTPAA